MHIEEFDYHLPRERIAQKTVRRGNSRLMVLPLNQEETFHARFWDLPDWLSKGDCLVINDSQVIPARLRVRKQLTGAKVELLLHRELSPGIWEALAKPCRRLAEGTGLVVGDHVISVVSLLKQGRVILRFPSVQTARRLINRYGITPLPPYIRRDDQAGGEYPSDRRRYQTIFARQKGSVAAPTAGLHFAPSSLTALKERGVHLSAITLHVGWGTFAPLAEANLASGELHPEGYEITETSARTIDQCRQSGGRIIACGTTVARTLESAVLSGGRIRAGKGETTLFIRPGYSWKIVSGLLTNFHLPQSSLLMLVSALGGRKRILESYRQAIQEKYRFYSYGDAMLLV
ncbi:tRNA preQ1(34) S-adenosylmethionine ribosyltransferase-isomerase QueA [bacterium]|nr:tRNA preQ1(34) S-adenosylmethionine ribosyltransferase-isomerase QueA [bacterium]